MFFWSEFKTTEGILHKLPKKTFCADFLCVTNILQIKRTDWVLKWPGQVVIAGCQTYWTSEVTEALENKCLKEGYQKLLSQLDDLRNLVRLDLKKIERMTLSALIVIEVHARDVVARMVEENVANANDFEWISQLRYSCLIHLILIQFLWPEILFLCQKNLHLNIQ